MSRWPRSIRCSVAIRAPSSWFSEKVKSRPRADDDTPAAIISTGTSACTLRTAVAIVRNGAITMMPSTPASPSEPMASGTVRSYGSVTPTTAAP